MLLHIDIHKLMKIIEKYFILDKRNKIFITIFLLILTMMLHFFIALHEIYSNYNFLGWIILLILFSLRIFKNRYKYKQDEPCIS